MKNEQSRNDQLMRFQLGHRRMMNRLTAYAEIQASNHLLTNDERTRLADLRPEYEFMRPKGKDTQGKDTR